MSTLLVCFPALSDWLDDCSSGEARLMTYKLRRGSQTPCLPPRPRRNRSHRQEGSDHGPSPRGATVIDHYIVQPAGPLSMIDWSVSPNQLGTCRWTLARTLDGRMRGAVFSHSTRWLHGERRRSEGSLAGSCQGAELAVSRGRAARAGRPCRVLWALGRSNWRGGPACAAAGFRELRRHRYGVSWTSRAHV